MRKILFGGALAVLVSLFAAGIVHASACSGDANPDIVGTQNACLPCNQTTGQGCLEEGITGMCVGGNPTTLHGCLSVGGGNNLCNSTTPPMPAPCSDPECAYAASQGCNEPLLP
jgi:hypothetical protein